MGYYVVKRDQDVGGSPSDFYYYTNVENDGVEDTDNPLMEKHSGGRIPRRKSVCK